MAISINSDTNIPIDQPFKVSAGPGAGKTHWLALHIKHVLKESKRLESIRRIACISYTNVGAETIQDRLPLASSCVEVCTIHSFLYTYVVKPFLHLDAEKYSVNLEKLKIVAIESFATVGFARIVQQSCGSEWYDPSYLAKGLRNCRWHYENGGYTRYCPDYPIKIKGTKYHVSQKTYDAYLYLMWSNGYISYEDVLYFATELLRNHPEIFKTLVAKFPYFFIDEFQDSIPPIVDFVKELGHHGVIVGVIGDKAQTIYDFIGASVQQFNDFTVPNMVDYEIHGNRRSSPQIIELLNVIRHDFPQTSIGTMDDIKPVLIVGDKLYAYQYVTEIIGSTNIHTLAFKNIIANSLRYNSSEELVNDKLIDSDFDPNFQRALAVRNLIKAIEYASNNDLSEAWHHLDALYDDRTESITDLRLLQSNRDDLMSQNLIVFIKFVKDNIWGKMPIPKKDTSARRFYESQTYLNMALSIKASDNVSTHKTIHKAKGEEFDNVMVVIGQEEDLSVITSPDISNNVAHRVYYVGMSRAKKKLFINVNSLSEENERILANLPIQIVRL